MVAFTAGVNTNLTPCLSGTVVGRMRVDKFPRVFGKQPMPPMSKRACLAFVGKGVLVTAAMLSRVSANAYGGDRVSPEIGFGRAKYSLGGGKVTGCAFEGVRVKLACSRCGQ